MKKLSEQLQQDLDCGDSGLVLEGYPERAKEIEYLLELCIKDLYSASGRFKKSTAMALYKYVNSNNIEVV